MKYLPRVLLTLSVFGVFFLFLLGGKLIGERWFQGVRGSLADGQIVEFEEFTADVETLDVGGAVGLLEYLTNYYPSGTKQVAGSELDWRVEEARSAALQRIIDQLRTVTGEDFGDDPEVWVAWFRER